MDKGQIIEFKNQYFKRGVIGLVILSLGGIVTYIIYKEVFLLFLGFYAFSQFLVSTQRYKITDEKIEFYSIIGYNNWKDIYIEKIMSVWVKNNAAIINYQSHKRAYSKTQVFTLTHTEALLFQNELLKRNSAIVID